MFTKENLIDYIPKLRLLVQNMPKHIFNQLYVVHFKPNQIILKKGQEIKQVYIQCMGKCKVVNEFADGHIYNFIENGPLNFIAGVGPLADHKYASVSVIASEDSYHLVMSKEHFLQWLSTDIYAAFFTLELYAKRLYPISSSRGRNMFIPALQKVVEYIYVKAVSSTQTKCKITKTRNELADEIGISIRSINRSLKSLAELNYISIIKGKIVIDKTQVLLLQEYIDENSI